MQNIEKNKIKVNANIHHVRKRYSNAHQMDTCFENSSRYSSTNKQKIMKKGGRSLPCCQISPLPLPGHPVSDVLSILFKLGNDIRITIFILQAADGIFEVSQEGVGILYL